MNKTIFYRGFAMLMALSYMFPAVLAENLPKREEILKTIVKVNDHYTKKHPEPLLGIRHYSRKKVD